LDYLKSRGLNNKSFSLPAEALAQAGSTKDFSNVERSEIPTWSLGKK